MSSHRFVGPDYSLIDDFPYPDDLEASAAAQAEYKEQVQVLLENSVQIQSVRAEMMDDGRTAEIIVTLESLVAGHNVPTGFTSERQLWLHITAQNPAGDILWETGDLDSDGNLKDHHSHDVIEGIEEEDLNLVNLQSKNVYIARHHVDNGSLQSTEDRFETSTIFPFDAQSIVRHSLEPLEVREYRWETDALDTNASISVELNIEACRLMYSKPYARVDGASGDFHLGHGRDHTLNRVSVWPISLSMSALLGCVRPGIDTADTQNPMPDTGTIDLDACEPLTWERVVRSVPNLVKTEL